jgi:integrase
MQEDLDHVQNMERAAADRLTKMQASERERAPQIELLELAAPSVGVWRPNYTQDAVLAVIGSFALGLFAVWFNGFIIGHAPARALLMHQTLEPRGLLHSAPVPQLGQALMQLPRVMNDPRLLQLPARDPLPRELDTGEVAALVSNTGGDGLLAVVGLLSGLTPKEIVALNWNDIDFAARQIAIGGETPRMLVLEEPFAAILEDRRKAVADVAAPVLQNGRGDPSNTAELDRLVLCAAYDANLSRPEQVTAAALRHTYLGYLLRCGIRATDIGRIAGHVPHEDLVGYMQLAASKSRLPLEEIDLVHPALRGLSAR